MKRFLQGVGAAALLLAAKLHETLPPTLLDLTELSENAYEPDALIMCEENLVNLLDWRLNPLTPFSWLMSFLARLDKIVRSFGLIVRDF